MMNSGSKIKKILSCIDIVFIYSFLAVLFKSTLFIGFLINAAHTKPAVFHSFRYVFLAYAFRPLYFSGFILIFLSFAFLFRNRGRIYYSLAVNFVLSVLILVDLLYLRGFSTMPTLHSLTMGGNMEGSLISSITALFSKYDWIFVIDIPIVLVFYIIRRDLYKKRPANLVAFILLFILSVGMPTVLAPVSNKLINKVPADWIINKLDSTKTTYNLSPVGFNVYSVYAFYRDNRPVILTSAQENNIKNWFAYKQENLPANQYKGLFRGKNLLVIQVESLEKFVINQKVNGQEITPTLNKLLKNSLYFSNVHEQVGEGTTSDAELMANTSVYPIRSGSTFFNYTNNTYNSLPKLFQHMGYYTSAIHPDSGAFWNWLPALSAIGFQKCIDSSHYNLSETIGLGISDGSYFKQVEPILLKQKQPFYTFMITLTSHTPFDLPKKYRELNLDPALDDTNLGGYFQSIHYTDKQLGLFIGQMEKDGLLDHTVIVIYGDHEGVHKYFTQKIQALPHPESWWLNNHKQTPLIIYQKQLQGKEIKTNGGEIDIMPTAAYLMGVDPNLYKNTAMGRNLLNTKKDFAVLHDREYMGQASSAKDKTAAISGLDIADLIIKTNYFKNHMN